MSNVMNSNPLVSVVMIFLNAEKFIQEAIESVFAQNYANWELLLVDDGSTDNSTKIAMQFTEQSPSKVHYLDHAGHQNRGMSASRNLGIYKAKGEYIAFLDADDVWLAHKLEQQVAILNLHPEAAMIYGSTQYWYSWTGNPEDIQRDFQPELGLQSNTLFKPPTLFTLCYPLGKATAPCPSDILLRRKVVLHVGGFEESFRGMYEDQAFLTKVYLKASVFVASQCWDRYRVHPDSCCSVVNKMGQYHSIRLFFLNWLTEYLSKQGIKDTQVWKTLQKALWPYRYPVLYYLLGRVQHLARQLKGQLKLLAQRTLLVKLFVSLKDFCSWIKSN